MIIQLHLMEAIIGTSTINILAFDIVGRDFWSPSMTLNLS